MFGKRKIFGRAGQQPSHTEDGLGNLDYIFPGHPEVTQHLAAIGSSRDLSLAAESAIIECLLDMGGADTDAPDFAKSLTLAGALAGIAAQQFVWRELIDTGRVSPGDEFQLSRNPLGDILYTSPTAAMAIVSGEKQFMSVWRLTCGAAVKAGVDVADLPDLQSVLTPPETSSGIYVTEALAGVMAGTTLGQAWKNVERILLDHDRPPRSWPIALGIVAQDILLQGQSQMKPLDAIRHVMLGAIFTVTMDPANIDPQLTRPKDFSSSHTAPAPESVGPHMNQGSGTDSGATWKPEWDVRQDAVADLPPLAGGMVAIQARREVRGKTAKAILDHLHARYCKDSAKAMATILAAAGAVAGFAAQQVVWRVYIEEAGAAPESYFLTVSSDTDDHTYYFGELANEIVGARDPRQLSIWHLVSATALVEGCREEDKPDLSEIFRLNSATLGEPHYGQLSVEEEFQPAIPVFDLLKENWTEIEEILVMCPGGTKMWPVYVGECIQDMMVDARGVIPPAIALQIVMEAAVSMSKIDPCRVSADVSPGQRTIYTE